MANQVRKSKKCTLSSALYYCIVADKCSCRHSNKEYCFTSMRYVTDNLQRSTIFLDFSRIPNTRAESVTSAIFNAIPRDEDTLI